MLLPILGLSILFFIGGAQDGDVPMILASVLIMTVNIVGLAGLFIVNPNEGRVLQLFGKYVGTVRNQGLRWTNPFYSKKAMPLRVRNFETERSKVNDTDGNPSEIAAVVVWRVVRHRRSGLRSRRLRELRAGAKRGGRQRSGDALSVRHTRREPHLVAR